MIVPEEVYRNTFFKFIFSSFLPLAPNSEIAKKASESIFDLKKLLNKPLPAILLSSLSEIGEVRPPTLECCITEKVIVQY
jgi:hypothetical protein